MSLTTALWKVNGANLSKLAESQLLNEAQLETWIENDSSLLGERLAVFGRQVTTEFGGRIDLLALDRDGALCVIELKRSLTPRDVVGQALDYASWIATVDRAVLDEIALRNTTSDLSALYLSHFGNPLQNDATFEHRIIIVASSFDDATTRIVNYLSGRYGVNINAVCFGVFSDEGRQYLSRSWLIDPGQVEERSRARADEVANASTWTGYWYLHIGEQPKGFEGGLNRIWEDCQKYNFVSAGQGRRYSRQLEKLKMGDYAFAYLNGYGYVGYCKVVTAATTIDKFIPPGYQDTLMNLPLIDTSLRQNAGDPELSDYAVGVEWLVSQPRANAFHFKGMFANQAVVCRLSDPSTLSFLEEKFGAPAEPPTT